MTVNLMSYDFPEAPFPKNVGACFTTRQGGFSLAPYNSLNLGLHAGDAPETVAKNRQKLCEDHQLGSISWLNQVHGTNVIDACATSAGGTLTEDGQLNLADADASYSSEKGIACAIMVADCMPVLVANLEGSIVGAAHAGWRGLCSGVIPNLISKMAIKPKETIVWLGPCIGKQSFEVGKDVFDAFSSSQSFSTVDIEPAFSLPRGTHYLADLQMLARRQLNSLGIQSVFSSKDCVYSNSERYFSYRREKNTGRMAALIWIKK